MRLCQRCQRNGQPNTRRNEEHEVPMPQARCAVRWFLHDHCAARYRHVTCRRHESCRVHAGSQICHASASNLTRVLWLPTYLRANNVKHRDIKPQNILVHKSNVLITDFGLSRDSLDTTSGDTLFTRRYVPPELVMQEQRIGSADVWSLGCVFLEMAAALHDHDVKWLKEYYEDHHTGCTHYYANPGAMKQVISEWEISWNEIDRPPLHWIRRMLVEDCRARPSAAEIWGLTTAADSPGRSAITFSGGCCAYHEGSHSSDESSDSDTRLSQRQWPGTPSSSESEGQHPVVAQTVTRSSSARGSRPGRPRVPLLSHHNRPTIAAADRQHFGRHNQTGESQGEATSTTSPALRTPSSTTSLGFEQTFASVQETIRNQPQSSLHQYTPAKDVDEASTQSASSPSTTQWSPLSMSSIWSVLNPHQQC